MVRLEGFEPPTFWFVAKHSIQLSYSRMSFVEPCLYYHSEMRNARVFFKFLFFYFLLSKIHRQGR